jgi:hypothetical protein
MNTASTQAFSLMLDVKFSQGLYVAFLNAQSDVGVTISYL